MLSPIESVLEADIEYDDRDARLRAHRVYMDPHSLHIGGEKYNCMVDSCNFTCRMVKSSLEGGKFDLTVPFDPTVPVGQHPPHHHEDEAYWESRGGVPIFLLASIEAAARQDLSIDETYNMAMERAAQLNAPPLPDHLCDIVRNKITKKRSNVIGRLKKSEIRTKILRQVEMVKAALSDCTNCGIDLEEPDKDIIYHAVTSSEKLLSNRKCGVGALSDKLKELEGKVIIHKLYVISLKNQIGDNQKLGKLDEDDKKTIEEAVDAAIAWLDANKEAGVEELKKQKKELEGKVQPIISKLYKDVAAPTEGEGESEGADEKDEL